MPNPLTGDFEAVLQVSSGTVNRLLASMHQNASTNPDTPSFPHSIQLRIGVEHLVDGVRGTVKAQIAAPRVELIDGATDRFWLEVAVRARYVPDSGTQPFPAFINGTVRAQYRIEDIDPQCFGWSQKASQYLWVRVVKDSVRFQGTTDDDRSLFEEAATLVGSTVVEDHAAVEARITRQVVALLATKFEASPHPVSKRFRRGSLRSIAATIGDSAVVSPIQINGDPVGDISSVESVFLKTADFAIALSREVILALAEPALAPIRGFNRTVPLADITVYRVTVDPPTVEWKPYGSFAVIKIKVSGNAKTNSLLPNATVDVEQDISLNFDGGSERLWLGVGSSKVTAHASGVFGGLIEGTIQDYVSKAVKAIVEAACKDAQPVLDAMIGRKQELITQLRTIDSLGNARVDDATFLPEGMILRGRISLSPRQGPMVVFEKTAEQDGHTAVRSWIPGGRIDKFEWTWGWFSDSVTGSTTFHDRFVLRRPHGSAGQWGQVMTLSEALPGLDGSGKVCLKIRGVQMDPVTGELQAVIGSYCHRFGFELTTKVKDALGGVFVPDVPELSQDVPFPQLALVDLSGTRQATSSSNTLVLYAGERLDREGAAALRSGLQDVRRTDAGLALLVLVPEGQLARARGGPLSEVERLREEIGLATVVSEDLGGRWAKAFDLRAETGQEAWRLIDPEGVVSWKHDGRITGEALAQALDRNLVTSPVPKPEPITTTVDVGRRIGAEWFRPGDFDLIDTHCPPFPVGRAGASGTVVTFVQRGSAASEAHLRGLATRQQQAGDAAPTIVVVVDGADGREADTYRDQLGLDFVVLADPKRSITDSFGVRVWPTTFALDHAGTVSGLEIGVGTRPDTGKGGESTA